MSIQVRPSLNFNLPANTTATNTPTGSDASSPSIKNQFLSPRNNNNTPRPPASPRMQRCSRTTTPTRAEDHFPIKMKEEPACWERCASNVHKCYWDTVENCEYCNYCNCCLLRSGGTLVGLILKPIAFAGSFIFGSCCAVPDCLCCTANKICELEPITCMRTKCCGCEEESPLKTCAANMHKATTDCCKVSARALGLLIADLVCNPIREIGECFGCIAKLPTQDEILKSRYHVKEAQKNNGKNDCCCDDCCCSCCSFTKCEKDYHQAIVNMVGTDVDVIDALRPGKDSCCDRTVKCFRRYNCFRGCAPIAHWKQEFHVYTDKTNSALTLTATQKSELAELAKENNKEEKSTKEQNSKVENTTPPMGPQPDSFIIRVQSSE